MTDYDQFRLANIDFRNLHTISDKMMYNNLIHLLLPKKELKDKKEYKNNKKSDILVYRIDNSLSFIHISLSFPSLYTIFTYSGTK